MPVRDQFITTDQACIVATNFAPLSAVNSVSGSHSVDVEVSAGTTGAVISQVEIFWGDGNSTVATLGVAPSYSASHTYASAGSYLVKVVTTLDNGQTQEDRFGPMVVS